jgi:probable F420-dependent oxidoreductase
VKVRFAVSVGLGPPDPALMTSILTDLEGHGFDTLWMSDVPSLPSTNPFAGIAYAAAVTGRVKLGANFIPFGRKPYLVAHELAQLDRLASGRLLVTLVPGLDLPGERAALGTDGRHRGRMMDGLIPLLRAWWSGAEVPDTAGLRLPVLPVQEPLEIWLGGSGPDAVERAGRLADGWLGSLVSPDRAGVIRADIEAAAAGAGRSIDPEHFGLSIGYARHAGDVDRAVRLRRPLRADLAGTDDLNELVPVGREALRLLVSRLVDRGLSKFVVRPIAPVESWAEELKWLADAVLDLQT